MGVDADVRYRIALKCYWIYKVFFKHMFFLRHLIAVLMLFSS